MARQTIVHYLILSTLYRASIGFIAAVYTTFLLAHGLDLLQVNLVNMVFYATLFLAEIPTGAIADTFGRKRSFVIACALHSAGMLAYAASGSLAGFMLAETIAAIGATCASGAFQAWLVDRLRYFGSNQPLSDIFAREQQFGLLAGILSAIAGAALGSWWLPSPWLAGSLLFAVTGIGAQLTMREEYFSPPVRTAAGPWSALMSTAKISVRYGSAHPVVKFIFLIGTLQFFATQAPNMQWQPYFRPGLPGQAWLGYLWTAIAVAMIAGSSASRRLKRALNSESAALCLSQCGIGLMLIITAAMPPGAPAISAFLVHQFARGTFRPIKDAYLNEHVPSAQRATMLSVESVSHHLGGFAGLFLSGYLAKNWGIPVTWALSGLALATGTLFILHSSRKQKLTAV